MLWKWKRAEEKATKVSEDIPTLKVERLSPKESMRKRIKQLEATQSLIYRLSEKYGGGNRVAIVELNPNSSGNVKRYILNVDILVAGKPAGGKISVLKSEDPKDITNWIWKFKSELLTEPELINN